MRGFDSHRDLTTSDCSSVDSLAELDPALQDRSGLSLFMVNENEIQAAASILKKLEPGKLPLPIFLEVARLTVTPIVEVVPIRKRADGSIMILFIKRDENDPNWPGLLHTPGTVVRSIDSGGGYKDAFDRILGGELKGTHTSEPVFVSTVLHKVKRGRESSLVFWVEVLGKPRVGELHSFDNLPENIIETQVKFINIAVRHFQNHSNK